MYVEPTPAAERIVALDVLRGVALLGILVMNVQSFSMIEAAYFNPTAYGDLTGANYVVWLVAHIFFDQKFMAIFSMLFGAGIVLMASRVEASGGRPAGLHYRRTFWLIVFGLLHAHLFWFGDVLFVYGVCGLWVYLFRKVRPGWLLTFGLLILSVSFLLYLFFGWSMPYWPAEQFQEFAASRQPGPEAVARELGIYRSGWFEQMEHRVPMALEMELFVIFIWGMWRAGGMMLIGMALYKLGVLTAQRSVTFYARMTVIGLAVGLPVVSYGVYRQFLSDWDPAYFFFTGTLFNYWGSLGVSLAWIGMVLWVYRVSTGGWLRNSLAAVGRMALTNYLMQSILCTTIFYGHGLGLYGRVERVGQVGIVVAIWILQLVVSPIWLRHFRYGPFEWLWRSLAYFELQPMRRA